MIAFLNRLVYCYIKALVIHHFIKYGNIPFVIFGYTDSFKKNAAFPSGI